MKFPKREEGQGLVEYALVLVLVAVVVILILQLLGSAVTVVYVRVIAGLNGQILEGSGREYLVSGASINSVDIGGGTCQVTLSNVTVVAFDSGATVSNTAISVPVVAGGSSSNLSGTTDSNGVASGLGAVLFAGCSGTVTIGNFSQGY